MIHPGLGGSSLSVRMKSQDETVESESEIVEKQKFFVRMNQNDIRMKTG